jgi:hypothetical protein
MLAAGGGRIVNISVNTSTMHRAGFIVAVDFDRWLRDRKARR